MFDQKARENAMIAMQRMSYKKDRTESHKVGFISQLFGEYESILTKEQFLDKVVEADCKWIFDDEQIRYRMRQFVIEEKLLNKKGSTLLHSMKS